MVSELRSGEGPMASQRGKRIAIVVMFVLSLARAIVAAEPDKVATFEHDIWPIVVKNCTACHGAGELESGLDLRTVAGVRRGGNSGPAINPTTPEKSLLLERVVKREMPPSKHGRLTDNELAIISAWVKAGTIAEHPDKIPGAVSLVRDEDRQFWSFRPLTRPAIPRVTNSARGRTPIDAFLLTRLEAKGISFSPDADPATLVRRVYLDLIGLPPNPAELDSYLADNQPGAYERLLDRLLASSHFGERWARHWLDVAGYVDTVGFDTDATNIILSEGKWKYRDYVIRALNDDKPYDRFLHEQLAGDEIYDWRRAPHFTPEIRDALIATGYLRTARDMTHEEVGVIPQNFFGIMHDTLEIMGTGLLGLTINCSRCHNHKFDPIPQEDYYRLMSMLSPAYNPNAWLPVIPYEAKIKDRGLPDVSPTEKAEIERHNAELDRQQAELRQKLMEIRDPYQQRILAARLDTLPEVIRADTQAARDTSADKRTEVQKYLAEKFKEFLTVKPEDVAAALSEDEKKSVAALEGQTAELEKSRRKWGIVQALYDVGPMPATRVLIRGNELTPGDEVVPGYLRVLCRDEKDALGAPAPVAEGSSGRRLAFARWLTNPESPASSLLARVFVNRVWQQLYGRGVVPTLDNFGVQGQPPSHPELLEWMACEFRDGGWKIKALIKSMMMTTAYQQASHRESTGSEGTNAKSTEADPEKIDPGNELLWRMRLRRLESEVVRDSILAISGKLNRTAGGPPILIEAKPDGMVVVAKKALKDPSDEYRRSVYLVARRAYNLSLLTVFDQPLVATNCLKRDASAVPLQSLMMLNDAFLHDQAAALALRIAREHSAVPEQQIEAAFRLVLVRRPNANELETCGDLLRKQIELAAREGQSASDAAHQGLVQLCHTLLNTSEFLYAE